MQPQQPHGTYGYPPPVKPRRTSPAIVIAAVVGAVVLLCCGGIGVAALLGGEPESDAGPGVAATTPAEVGPAGTPPPTLAPGTPPWPDAATQVAYLADLNAIDPAIVTEKDPRTLVQRGRSQCTSIKEWPDDQAKLVDLTNRRFGSPEHPDGYGKSKATKILAAIRKHICPTY